MGKLQSAFIGIRLTPQMKAQLEAFAEQHNMRNLKAKGSDWNISEAARTILALALSHGVPGSDNFGLAMQNARAEWLERVNAGWRAAMEALTSQGLERW